MVQLQLLDDWAETAHDTLVDHFGAKPNKRYVGYFYGMSMREVMSFIDPSQIQEIHGKRRVQEHKSTLPIPVPWMGLEDVFKKNVVISYNRSNVPGHTDFDWRMVEDWLDQTPHIHDMIVDRVVIKVNGGGFKKFWEQYMERALVAELGLTGVDLQWIAEPFYIEMSTRSPGSKRAWAAVDSYMDDRCFLSVDEYDSNGNPGLGWKERRTLDVDAVWSARGYVNKGGPVLKWGAEKMTPRKIEYNLVNGTVQEDKQYGAVNSNAVINRVQSLFSNRGHTPFDTKDFEWEASEGWKQVR